MYLLDTGVVSEIRRPQPHPSVARWIVEVPSDRLFVSAVSVGEIQAGIQTVRDWDPRSATELEAWLDAVVESGAILPMDAECLRERARIEHRGPRGLRTVATIAAPARVHQFTVVTRDVHAFRRFGVACVNPFDSRS